MIPRKQTARERAQRRKSPWNLLLFFAFWPLWFALWFESFHILWEIHVWIYPAHASKFNEFMENQGNMGTVISGFLLIFGPFMPTLMASMLIVNFLTHLIPPARRAFDREAEGYPGTDYLSSQKFFLKYLPISCLIGFGLALLGAVTLRLR
jgi:hypothetical protein